MLIASAAGKDLESMLLQHQSGFHKHLVSFKLSQTQNVDRFFSLLEICKPWAAVYDEKQKALYTQYHIESPNDDYTVYLCASQEEAADAVKFVSDCALQKTEYFLIPQHDDNQNTIGKSLPNGEYTSFNLARGMKEFVYSLSTPSPILPVLCQDSLTRHPQTGWYAVRLYSLNIDQLDLHLQHSREAIFNTLKRNLIDSYKTYQQTSNSD